MYLFRLRRYNLIFLCARQRERWQRITFWQDQDRLRRAYSYERAELVSHVTQVPVITRSGVKFTDYAGKAVSKTTQRVLWDPIAAEKGGHKHFMLKEIYEQPWAVRETVLGRASVESGRVFLSEMALDAAALRDIDRIIILACGTSWHSALVGKFLIEELERLESFATGVIVLVLRDPETRAPRFEHLPGEVVRLQHRHRIVDVLDAGAGEEIHFLRERRAHDLRSGAIEDGTCRCRAGRCGRSRCRNG